MSMACHARSERSTYPDRRPMISSILKFENSEAFAKQLDADDELAKFRQEFFMPTRESIAMKIERQSEPAQPPGEPCIYLAGNSLGLQPKSTRRYIDEELVDWANLGVEGHWNARHPWLPYHEFLTEMSARIVGAKPLEVVVMNTLTVNLHLMMVSFYRPTKERYKI